MINPINTVELVQVYKQNVNKSSLDFKILIKGVPYDFAIRYLGEDKHPTILKDGTLWNVETKTFGYPED